MAQSTVQIHKLHDSTLAVGWAGQHTLAIDRPERSGGTGRGFSAGELLRLAVGACYAISLSREAVKRGLALTGVELDVQIEWDGEPERIQRISCVATVTAEASEEAIRDLIRNADQRAEVVNSLRPAFAVTLADLRAGHAASQGAAPARTAPHADAVLELASAASDATCAVLTPAIKARLSALAGGQTLEVRVGDPSAHDDIAAWCRLAGHDLLAVVDDPPHDTRYFVRKKL